MLIWFVIMLFAATGLTTGCLIFSLSKRSSSVSPVEDTVRQMMFFAVLTLSCYGVGLLMRTERSARIMFSIFHVLNDMVIVALLIFARRYTGKGHISQREKRLINAAGILDTALAFANIFTNVLFDVEPLYDRSGKYLYHLCRLHIAYSFHVVFTYLAAILAAGYIARKMAETPGAYKFKYAVILCTTVPIQCLNLMYLYMKLRVDYSLILYSAAAIIIFYFSVIYVPRGLMERLLFYTIANMNDGIICIDIDGRIVHTNQNAMNYCQADRSLENIELQIKEWFASKVKSGAQEGTWDTRVFFNGENRYYNIEYKQIYDPKRKYIGCFFLIHDRTDDVNRFNAENYRATHDLLTGLYNKDCFYETAHRILNESPDEDFYIVCTDVKSFKLINDIFGVEAGDALLKSIADITGSFEAEGAVCGRITGDRFAMLMTAESLNEEELLERYSEISPFFEQHSANAGFKVHIHMGIYHITDRSLRVSVMCDRANLAIQTIKDSYENMVAYYQKNLRENFVSQQKVIAEFDNALQTSQFCPYIQPQVDSSGKVSGGEALVRWLHPVDGLVFPGKFIGIFEQTGLISRLDKYMWEEACKKLQQWHSEGMKDVYLSVNISQKDFYLLDVYEVITSLVEKYGIEPSSLHLEITETAIMNDPVSRRSLISKLREYGFIIEIDDFGSGYSSLNMLKDIEADVLKVDMGFLTKTDNAEKSKVILRSIITLAKSLDMEVIIEGVEDKEQIGFLNDCGCNIYQGYFFSKPIQISEFENNFLNSQVAI
ncbi:MAG: EAL domain-containing protein [Ruminococcus sp.]|nr:EAL domain-containing protein [Ruminococcus sp.]